MIRPAAAPAVSRDGGKFVCTSDRFTGARVGQGGPEIQMDGFNGDIHVRRRDGA